MTETPESWVPNVGALDGRRSGPCDEEKEFDVGIFVYGDGTTMGGAIGTIGSEVLAGDVGFELR